MTVLKIILQKETSHRVKEKDREIEALRQQIKQTSDHDSDNTKRITELETLLKNFGKELHDIQENNMRRIKNAGLEEEFARRAKERGLDLR